VPRLVDQDADREKQRDHHDTRHRGSQPAARRDQPVPSQSHRHERDEHREDQQRHRDGRRAHEVVERGECGEDLGGEDTNRRIAGTPKLLTFTPDRFSFSRSTGSENTRSVDT
jgi:hypothetical protein